MKTSGRRPFALRSFFALVAALACATFVARAAVPPSLDDALVKQKALATAHPDDPGVLNDLGNLEALAGATQAAETSYRRALELAPDDAAIHYNLGLVLAQRGDRSDAARQYRKVLALAPDHAWAHFQLGRLLEEQGLDDAAIAHYARAFALDPQLSFADVNPQIIDSRLMTRALLAAYGSRSPADVAPRLYAQPDHVAGLLLPAVPAAKNGEGTATQAGAETAMRPTPALSDAETTAGAEPATGVVPPARRLDASDLTGGFVGQATGGAASDDSTARGGVRVPAYRLGRGRSRRGDGQRGGRTGTSQTRRSPNGSPGVFEPAPPSTGRLDLERSPLDRDEPAIAAGR